MSRPILTYQEDDWYIAKDIISNVTTQGKTYEEAINNIKEAISLYYENNNMNDDTLKNMGISNIEMVA